MEKSATYNPEADKRWREKNRAHANYLSARRAARSFIRNRATMEDLDEIEMLVAEKRKQFAEEAK